jgi:hypothetical protein
MHDEIDGEIVQEKLMIVKKYCFMIGWLGLYRLFRIGCWLLLYRLFLFENDEDESVLIKH